MAPNADAFGTIVDVASVADGSLDLIGIQDHPYQRRFLDTSALLSHLGARTSRIRLFHDVACLPLRHPAMLANEAAAIDIMSGGRFELGLGAGAFWDAIAAMDGPRRTPAEALEALEEAVEVIRLMWSGDRGLLYSGRHYTIDGIHSGPVPVHDIEIWLGVYGPKACAMLGRIADGWLPSLGRAAIADLASRHRIIDEAAEEAGRVPSSIRRLLNVGGTITDGATDGPLNGPAEQWAEELTGLVEHGFDTFIFWPETNPLDQIHRFTELTNEVIETVARSRSHDQVPDSD